VHHEYWHSARRIHYAIGMPSSGPTGTSTRGENEFQGHHDNFIKLILASPVRIRYYFCVDLAFLSVQYSGCKDQTKVRK
jgi:hypothetical protein